jgi:hypothetical protein
MALPIGSGAYVLTTRESATVTDFSHSRAVIIGIDAYGGGIPPLPTAVNDATRLAEVLKTEHGYEITLPSQDVTTYPEMLTSIPGLPQAYPSP